MDEGRVELIGASLRTLVVAVNAISEEDIAEILHSISRELSLGPMIDPTTWRDRNLFDTVRGTEKVIQALLDFKREVKGIGGFK